MIKDFESDEEAHEQITKALSRQDWFTKWGYSYLLSLSSAHLTRQCHNFKDQGVQLYGNTLFQNLQDEVYQLFSTIKPPTPTLRAQVVRTSMSAYVNRSGGCFGPKCQIKLVNGVLKSLEELDGSELVYQGDGIKGAKIRYVTKTKIPSKKVSMCQIGELQISEYHPFWNAELSDAKWDYPINHVESTQLDLDWMYNIVLESGYWIEIEGYKCVSLGHNITDSTSETEVLVHDYFGSSKVITDLEKFKVNKDNKIIILDNFVVSRNNVTGLVCGINKILYEK